MRELLLAIQCKLTQCLENQNITEEICLEDIIKIMSDYYSTSEPKIITEILDGGVIMNDELRKASYNKHCTIKSNK